MLLCLSRQAKLYIELQGHPDEFTDVEAAPPPSTRQIKSRTSAIAWRKMGAEETLAKGLQNHSAANSRHTQYACSQQRERRRFGRIGYRVEGHLRARIRLDGSSVMEIVCRRPEELVCIHCGLRICRRVNAGVKIGNSRSSHRQWRSKGPICAADRGNSAEYEQQERFRLTHADSVQKSRYNRKNPKVAFSLASIVAKQ
jgi:hypothetical protein